MVAIPGSCTRKNVIPGDRKTVHSERFDLAGPSEVKVSGITREYPTVFRLLNSWCQQECGRNEEMRNFRYTSVQLNAQFTCK